jgi:membrane protein DedA with SNARE-associated domain
MVVIFKLLIINYPDTEKDMIPEMIQLILTAICLIVIGIAIYYFKFRKKGNPKVGIKRDNLSEYFNDYWEFKLYWGSISFIVSGVIILLTIGILELFFN